MSIFTSIINFFKSQRAKQALQTAASLAEIAAPIIAQIAALTPNKTDDEIMTAYAKFGVPFVGVIAADPNAAGNALLNLGTAVLKNRLPSQYFAVANNVIQTAVQMAVTAHKAG